MDLTGGIQDMENSNISSVGSSLFYVSSPDEVTKLNNELKVCCLSKPSLWGGGGGINPKNFLF